MLEPIPVRRGEQHGGSCFPVRGRSSSANVKGTVKACPAVRGNAAAAITPQRNARETAALLHLCLSCGVMDGNAVLKYRSKPAAVSRELHRRGRDAAGRQTEAERVSFEQHVCAICEGPASISMSWCQGGRGVSHSVKGPPDSGAGSPWKSEILLGVLTAGIEAFDQRGVLRAERAARIRTAGCCRAPSSFTGGPASDIWSCYVLSAALVNG